MKNVLLFSLLLLSACIAGVYSCISSKSKETYAYVGNFEEQKFPFFESIYHANDTNYYYSVPFNIKFVSIRPFSEDSSVAGDYAWLRKPSNLLVAFNTAKSIGLNNFISKEQYYKKNKDWCCNTQWENKSLNEIVKGFLQSDTVSSKNEYYTKFWSRRRKEKNLTLTYSILKEIDRFYTIDGTLIQNEPIDTVLQSLLRFDLQLAKTMGDSTVTLSYFNYLKSIGLNYSAYKLIFHNSAVHFKPSFKDSLLLTIKHDTLSKTKWEEMNDNNDGWLKGYYYSDPNRYYGP